MKLERVDITGFKSFAEKVELSFHEGVTAIVGPNGCGKSNIADAIGWVLGEQSAKSLRGQRMEDVIFGGSEARSPLSLAEVNLRVSQVQIPVPGGNGERSSARGDVLVTRRLHRSGESEYLLDGVPSRLRDIQELFMGTGVGSKAYAIIEQGKIGLILSSKPTDRRVLIEEAAGITKYKSRRRSAELKLQAAQQNLLRVNDIVYEINRQMNSLKRQAGKARRYRRLREQIGRLEMVVAVRKAQVLEARLATVRHRLEAIGDEELRRAASLSTAEGFLERARLRQAEREVALNDAREALHQADLTIDRLETSIERDKGQLVELGDRRTQLETEWTELEARLGPVRKQLSIRGREQAELDEELQALEARAEAEQGRLKEASFSLSEMESRIEARRAEIVHRISKVAALNNFLQSVLANTDKVSAELSKLEEESREVEAEQQRLGEGEADVSRELHDRRREAEGLVSERTRLESECRARNDELDELERGMSQRKEELSRLAARLASLEELVRARAHFASGARLVLRRGSLQGIGVKGSVADAIEVDERFERAAEAFFDKALQRVRLEEPDLAAVRALLAGEEEAGRTELLVETLPRPRPRDLSAVLDKLRARNLPGVVGLLSDGVRWASSELAGAAEDGVVVESLDDGLRCYREEPAPYVSLSGEIVEPPGVVAMGPGGASEGLLSSRREIRELKEAVAAGRSRLDELGERRSELERELEEKRRRLEAIREQQHHLEKTIVGLEHRESQLQEERARIERKRDVLASELARSRSEKSTLGKKRSEMESSLDREEAGREEAEAALEAMRRELSEHRASVSELQSRALQEGSRLAALRERRDSLKLDVERLKEGVEELESRMEANRRESQALSERKSRLREAVARAEQELRQSMESREEEIQRGRVLEAELARLRERVDTTEVALKTRRRELQEVRERRSGEEVALAKEESELGHLRESFEAAHGVTLAQAGALLSPAELASDDDETQETLSELRRKLEAIGPVNPMADEEYRELEKRYEFVTRQRQDLLDSIESTETAINRIDRTSRQRFKEAFEAINHEFEATFKQLFGGGRAGLRLLDEDDILESGIDVIASPPGKKLQNVLLLSGGEKALSAIALLFAIFRYRPSPFCLLDEVDAPLDDANVGRFLSILRELRDTTQFIIITHNRKTMEMADQLYGVTMGEPGISKLVSVNMVSGAPVTAEAVAT